MALETYQVSFTGIPEKVQEVKNDVTKVWKVADIVQTTVCSLLMAIYTVYSFTELLTPVPELLGGAIQKMRIIAVVSLPFIAIRIISNIRSLTCGSEERTRWESFFKISGDLGLFATNLSSFLSGFSKLTALSAKVAIVAQWTGIAGIALQSTGILLETICIIRSIQILDKYEKGEKFTIACPENLQKSIANLTTDQKTALSTVPESEKLKKHLIKRIHFTLGSRVIHIITMLFTIAATALFLASVPAIIPLAIGFAVVVVSLILHPAEILIKNHFDNKFELLRQGTKSS